MELGDINLPCSILGGSKLIQKIIPLATITLVVFVLATLAALSVSDPTRADEGESLILIADANRKIGFITEQGQVVVAPQFDSALEFAEGLAAVYTNSQWGYLDLNGQWAIEPR